MKTEKSRYLKITEKVSFNIASEASKASYVYILSGQKLIKNAKNSPYWLTVKQCSDKSKLLGQKCQNSNETFLSNF